jgi:putative membrane protein
MRYNTSMNNVAGSFFIRWLVCSLGLWLAAGLLRDDISYGNSLSVIILAGFLLAVLNMFIKPVFILLSLPVIVLTLGLFIIVINGLMVYLLSKLYPPLQITNFWAAVFASLVIGLVNYVVTATRRS